MTAEPPAWVSKKCAAQVAIEQQHDLRGGQRRDGDQHQRRRSPEFSQTNSGIRPSVIPGSACRRWW